MIKYRSLDSEILEEFLKKTSPGINALEVLEMKLKANDLKKINNDLHEAQRKLKAKFNELITRYAALQKQMEAIV